MEDAFPAWIQWLKNDPANASWYAGWELVLEKERISVGCMGFAGPPDASGTVTAGYCVDLRHRGCGYASEALRGLCDWAFADARVQKVRATIPEWNAPSVRVAEKSGFRLEGRTVEEGMELLVFELQRS